MASYKITNTDGTTRWGFQWPLPEGEAPGEWVEVEGPLVPCENGLHLLRRKDICRWLDLYSPPVALWEAEHEGEVVEDDKKFVTRRARLLRRVGTLDDRMLRLCACEFAERALPLWESAHPDDMRPREAIEVSRRFANGEATRKELRAAAEAAERLAQAKAAAWSAAWSAAEAAAEAAAWSAAWSAAEAAERLAQAEIILRIAQGRGTRG
jgi:hypothetical protein